MKFEFNTNKQIIEVRTKTPHVDMRKPIRKLSVCSCNGCNVYTNGTCIECGINICHIHCVASTGMCYECLAKKQEENKSKNKYEK